MFGRRGRERGKNWGFSPTSRLTLLAVPALSATYTASALVGSAMTARILLERGIGEPFLFLDLAAFRVVAARDWLSRRQ